MHKKLLELLDSSKIWKLTYDLNDICNINEVEYGSICSEEDIFLIEKGVPSFCKNYNCDQEKTNETFSAKWNIYMRENNGQTYRYMMDFVIKRLIPLGIKSEKDFETFLRSKKMILDAGSGNGWMSQFMEKNTEGIVISAEIGDGVYAAYEKCGQLKNCHVIKADLMDLPFSDNSFDFIYSDGVLHHTPDTKLAMKALYDKLQPGGIFWFYIYKEMNPVKHFCDDYIRGMFTKLSPEDALKQCEAITELGRELSKINGTITLQKPIELLNIPAGTYNLQRFIYYNFIKCFWNESIGYDASNIINFDWFHPNNAQQQTEQEVRCWFEEYGIIDYDIYIANPNGMNIVIRK